MMERRPSSQMIALALVTTMMGGLPPVAAPQQPSASPDRPVYWCPMHPDVRGSAGETCPICSMTLVLAATTNYESYRLDVETTPRVVHERRPFRVRLLVRDPHTQLPVRRFLIVHDRVFHLFVVS